MPKLTREKAIESFLNRLWAVKEQVCDLNDFAEKYGIFVDDPTVTLNISCMIDEVLNIAENDGRGTC